MACAMTLVDWLEERQENANRIAKQKTGADRDGWLEDAAYFARAVEVARKATLKPKPDPAGAERKPADASHAADWVTTGHGRGPNGEALELGQSAGVTVQPISAAEEVASAVRRSVSGAWELARTRNDAEGAFASYNLAVLGALYNAERRCQALAVERDKWREALHAKERILIDARIQELDAVITKVAGLLHRGWITEAIDVIDGLGPAPTETTEAERSNWVTCEKHPSAYFPRSTGCHICKENAAPEELLAAAEETIDELDNALSADDWSTSRLRAAIAKCRESLK